MNTGIAVIGANYGDEGKGLFTDYFASQSPQDSLVIRYNGGAQAGHTVVEPDGGKRHVFSHIGAGSFVGASTYLSQFFIVNPILFNQEYAELKRSGVTADITININALVTTPFDMLINQMLELSRGQNRHGSCGLGINETVTRSLSDQQYSICVKDLLKPNTLRKRLNRLTSTWFNRRLTELQLENCVLPESLSFKNSSCQLEDSLDQFIEQAEKMLSACCVVHGPPSAKVYIFEGAQGLLLSEERLDLFPHLTRSRTGSTNIITLANEIGLDALELVYVSRSYLTRHGAGPLINEANWSYPDKTNLGNQFQGDLRFAPLDLSQLENSIILDLQNQASTNIKLEPVLAITCLDQNDNVPKLPFAVKYRSYGPSREYIESRELIISG